MAAFFHAIVSWFKHDDPKAAQPDEEPDPDPDFDPALYEAYRCALCDSKKG